MHFPYLCYITWNTASALRHLRRMSAHMITHKRATHLHAIFCMCLNDHTYTHKFILRYFLKQKHNHVRTRRREDTMHVPVAHMSTRKRSLAPCPGYIMLIKVRLYQQSTALTLAWSESEIHTFAEPHTQFKKSETKPWHANLLPSICHKN